MDDKIIDFLIRAKKATYAGKGPEATSSRPNSHDLHYEEDSLKYIDTYLGGFSFAGEEAIWKDDVPIWAMNYVGRVLSEEFSGDFLKEALSLVSKENPYRGPLLYEKDDYLYQLRLNGEFEWFNGIEIIRFKGKRIYECLIHGGEIIC
jgi:hypothetical protein